MTKLYDIYANGKVLYSKLSEEEFQKTWEMINHFLSIYSTKSIQKEDLKYTEIFVLDQ